MMLSGLVAGVRHVQDAFSALEQRISDAGVYVDYAVMWLFDRPNGEVGLFFPNEAIPGAYTIRLFRPHAVSVPGDLLFELCTLAHEFGHYRSFERGERTAEYDHARAVFHRERDGDLDHEGRLRILDEERRAWLYGRAELEELGFRAWEAFDVRTEESLAIYRDKLGL